MENSFDCTLWWTLHAYVSEIKPQIRLNYIMCHPFSWYSDSDGIQLSSWHCTTLSLNRRHAVVCHKLYKKNNATYTLIFIIMTMFVFIKHSNFCELYSYIKNPSNKALITIM